MQELYSRRLPVRCPCHINRYRCQLCPRTDALRSSSPVARRHGSRRDTLNDSSPSSSTSSAGLQPRQGARPSVSGRHRSSTLPSGQGARISSRGKRPVNAPAAELRTRARRAISNASPSHRQSQPPQRSASYSTVSRHPELDEEPDHTDRTAAGSAPISFPHTGKRDRPLQDHHHHPVRRRTQSHNDPALPDARPVERRPSQRPRPLSAANLLSPSASAARPTSSSTIRAQDQPSLQSLLQEVDVTSALQLVKSVQLQSALSQSHNQQQPKSTSAAHLSQPPRSLSPESIQTGPPSSIGATSVRPLLKEREGSGSRRHGDDGVHKKETEGADKEKDKSKGWHFPGFGGKPKKDRDSEETAEDHMRAVPGLQNAHRAMEGTLSVSVIDGHWRTHRLGFLSCPFSEQRLYRVPISLSRPPPSRAPRPAKPILNSVTSPSFPL
jgi:hypothetical protein